MLLQQCRQAVKQAEAHQPASSKLKQTPWRVLADNPSVTPWLPAPGCSNCPHGRGACLAPERTPTEGRRLSPTVCQDSPAPALGCHPVTNKQAYPAGHDSAPSERGQP